MDYAKIRKSLIILVFVVNLFLLNNLFGMEYSKSQQNYQTITENLKTLENQGIYIARELYEKSIYKYPIYQEYDYINTENIRLMLGEIESSDNNIYISKDGVANIKQNGYFAITLNKEYTKDEIIQKLILAGFLEENMLITIEENILKIGFKINNIDVFNCSIEVILNSSNTLVEGNWIFLNEKTMELDYTYSIMQLLLQINEEKEIKSEIIEINPYYYTGYNNMQVLTPCYEVVCVDLTFCVDIYGQMINSFK